MNFSRITSCLFSFSCIFLFLSVFAIAGEKPEVFVSAWPEIRIDSGTSFSPDGNYFLITGKESHVFDTRSGKEVQRFDWKSVVDVNNVNVIVSRDSKKLLTIGIDTLCSLETWDIVTGEKISSLTINDKQNTTCVYKNVTLSPDGRYLIMTDPGGLNGQVLKLLDTSSGKVKKLSGAAIHSVAVSPDGRFVAAAVKGASTNIDKIVVYDIAKGKASEVLTKVEGPINNLVFAPNGMLLTSSWPAGESSGDLHGKVILWDIKSRAAIRTVGEVPYGVRSLTLSRDGKQIACGGNDEILRVWELSSGKEILAKHLRNPVGQGGGGIQTISYNMNGNSILAFTTSAIQSIKLTGETKIISALNHVDPWVGNQPTDHSLVAASSMWNLSQGTAQMILTPNIYAITSDYKQYIGEGVEDDMFFYSIFDAKNGKEIKRLFKSSEQVFYSNVSPNDDLVLFVKVNEISIWSIKEAKERYHFKIEESPVGISISPNGQIFAYAAFYEGPNKQYVDSYTLVLRAVSDGHLIDRIDGVFSSLFLPGGQKILLRGSDGIYVYDEKMELKLLVSPNYSANSFVLSKDEKVLYASDQNNFNAWTFTSGKEIRRSNLQVALSEDYDLKLSNDGAYLFSNDRKSIRMRSTSTGKIIAEMTAFRDGEWVIVTPEGYYNSSPNGEKNLNVRIGGTVYGIENFRETFFRPDHVKLALAGKSLKDFKTFADIKLPPRVTIVDTPETVDKDEVTVQIKLTDIGGGIGDVRLYLNGSSVALHSGRGVKISPKNGESDIVQAFTIKLSKGENIIRAIAFNGDNTMFSNEALHEVIANFQSFRKPSLHALIIGIQEFKNPKLSLNYAVADANLFAETISKGATGLFETINIRKLTVKEDSTRDNIIAALKQYQSLNPDDLFIFYVASHGTVDDGEYFLITSNVGSTRIEKLKTDALSQRDLKELVANIPATKKLIVIDTCNAAALGDAMQVAMMTRGMSEDTAMKVLSRAVGSTILSASTSVQEAMEGYNGHGLFTWVLAEGLNGKADKGRSGFVKTTELADYVDNEVPEIAEKIFKKKQFPTISLSGMGFPITKSEH